MVKAELIESPEVTKETGLITQDNVPNVDVAIEQWDAYQKLCKGLLNDTDYQEIIVKEKDENGNYVKVKRHFKKKSASGGFASMPKPARLYPKEDPMNLNPKVIMMGSILFAIMIGWIGIVTSTVGL